MSSQLSTQSMIALLAEHLPDLPLIGPEALAARHPGEHPHNLGSGLMAEPRSTEELSALMTLCHRHDIPVVPQGGRTGLVGGGESRPGELIVSTARFNAIAAIHAGERTAEIGAGVTLEALQDACRPLGLTPGIDLAARGSATIGGMISTNAGGILAFRNGVMRHQVLGLEAVLHDGTVFSDLTRVVKVSAGPDLKQIFIGAEGAFGIVTRAVIRLEALALHRATALVGVASAQAALAIAARLQAEPALTLQGSELMWRDFFIDSAAAHGFDAGFLPAGTPAVLLIEVSGESEAIARDKLETVLSDLWEDLGIEAGLIAQSLDQARRFWALREQSSFIYHVHPDAPSYDVSLPPSLLDAYRNGLMTRLAALDPTYGAYVYGHIADGNLHISVTGAGHPDEARLDAIGEAIYAGVQQAGGSFSAEHGVGTEKEKAWKRHVSPVKQALSLALKRALDPADRFNRGKVPFSAPRIPFLTEGE